MPLLDDEWWHTFFMQKDKHKKTGTPHSAPAILFIILSNQLSVLYIKTVA